MTQSKWLCIAEWLIGFQVFWMPIEAVFAGNNFQRGDYLHGLFEVFLLGMAFSVFVLLVRAHQEVIQSLKVIAEKRRELGIKD